MVAMDSERLTSSSSGGILPLHKHHHGSQSDGDRSLSGSPPSLRKAKRYNSGGSDKDDSLGDNISLPTWSANPQSPLDETNANNSTEYAPSPLSPTTSGTYDNSRPYYFSTTQQYNNNRRQNSQPMDVFYSWLPSCKWVIFGVAFLAGMVAVLQSRGSLIYSLEEVLQLVHNNNVLRNKLNDAEKGIKLLQREVSAYDVMRHQQQQQQNHPTALGGDLLVHKAAVASDPRNRALEEMQQLSERLQDSQKRADRLKEKVQRLSKTEALAKYGDHIHRVEIELSFPDGREGPTRFVIELAPLELMPHSVHFFLEMVSKGLLDGCSFILNALHVLKAAPLPYDGSSAANKARAFTRMGLESVSFKEYASSYPHEQYTVGFAADGSPSFYINTEDNSEIHLGDPCFGKIVEGYDTVKRLEASPTRNGIWFEQRIGIKKATVLI